MGPLLVATTRTANLASRIVWPHADYHGCQAWGCTRCWMTLYHCWSMTTRTLKSVHQQRLACCTPIPSRCRVESNRMRPASCGAASDPMEILETYITHHKLRLIDLFHRVRLTSHTMACQDGSLQLGCRWTRTGMALSRQRRSDKLAQSWAFR